MRDQAGTIRLEDLLDRDIVTAEGRNLGRIIDVVLTPTPPYRVTALLFGQRGWIERLDVLNPFTARLASENADRVPWDAVERCEGSTVTLKRGARADDSDDSPS